MRVLGTPAVGVIPALVLGAVVMLAHDAPLALPLTNLAAAVTGFVVVLLAGHWLAVSLDRRALWVAAAVLAVELCTLTTAGILEVRRWISLGGVRLHPAAVASPLLLLAVVVLWQRRRTWTATCRRSVRMISSSCAPGRGTTS